MPFRQQLIYLPILMASAQVIVASVPKREAAEAEQMPSQE
jgi:hypothetical protein